MKFIIQASIQTLKKSQILLEKLSNDQLCNELIPPYNSSIGTHIRHILDFYDCIFEVNSENRIDLTKRKRNKEAELNCESALIYVETIVNKLNSISFNVNTSIIVIDDLGLGKIEIPYTFGALIAQANSHTIHHYAIINYILDGLGISIEDEKFGYNPTTPKAEINLS